MSKPNGLLTPEHAAFKNIYVLHSFIFLSNNLYLCGFLSDFYKSTDFGQPVRGSQAYRFPELHHRHDTCDAVFRRVPTQDGGKHNIIPTTGLQVVVTRP